MIDQVSSTPKHILPAGNRRPRVLTWHIHGSYLHYLTHANCEFFIPVDPTAGEGYAGRTASFPWRDNLHQIPAQEVKQLAFDCILFQSKKNYLIDQYTLLSPEQRQLPKLYLEHDPPREHPTDTKHVVNDPGVVVVDVTHFNNLMWDHGASPSTVIEHGVTAPTGVKYTGQLNKGIVVINNLAKRGRRLGLDIFNQVRQEVPLDIVGMGASEVGGLGEVAHDQLPAFISQYRFFFNPIRYTSLGLSICEAMMVGLPVVGLATTELVSVIENGVNGYIDTNLQQLIQRMQKLLDDRTLACQLGDQAQATAKARFGIERFAQDWTNLFKLVLHSHHHHHRLTNANINTEVTADALGYKEGALEL